ncbi:MAG: type II toxin-antitoxin system VapC family toxin [Acidobacteriota bacterium]
MNYLVDTNVISELAGRSPNAGVAAWARTVTGIFLSVITLEEISYGLTWKPNPRVQAWFDDFFAASCTICPVEEEVAVRAGQIRGLLAKRGRQRTQADMLIAATAQVRQLTLVTRNTRDFDECGIALLDPFS